MGKHIVYKTSPDGEFKTLEVPKSLKTQEVGKTIIKKEGQPYNWFEASGKANTPIKAIQEAMFAGFQYCDPKEVAATIIKGRGGRG